ncbi:anaerobic ribonucleoside-triphosphate reductase activating protein [Tenuifilum thalassicum]|uniref:Anaerobic ribonucleoside-triphosphate reductase activating protein n=1 Tax=Tenuifilum thalassicum TaxID=2590900 RepID=A0A7D3XKI3_9BACT|nr:anaerobic ribonucleoside-triphosphate reductase activating protein [Tenuifilum thalassicum]QKG79555.1 anaerobic ribonucleoside-triphosphate reductase activating protein [Tenuifilum thalassicum]
MKIAAIQQHSLIDYPGLISCVIFTYGCNFRCWYCHNHWLVLPSAGCKQIDTDSVFNFLAERVGWLDGVVISGGEPTLHPDLPTFIKQIKQFGFRVKLDTNGTNPKMVEHLIDASLVDYVAMDIKALPTAGNYSKVIGVADSDIIELVKKSIAVLQKSQIEYQFRITWPSDKPKSEIDEIEQVLNGCKLHVNELTLENGILADYLTF